MAFRPHAVAMADGLRGPCSAMPVAATGLWMRAQWGPVLWFVAAVGEIAIYSVFARHFEYRPLVVGFNAVCLLIYVVFRVLLYLEKRRLSRVRITA